MKVRAEQANPRDFPLPDFETVLPAQVAVGARSGDLVSWRKAIAAQKGASLRELLCWRDETLKRAATTPEEAHEQIRAGLAVYQPLFALAVAGVGSGEARFRQHGSLVYDLLEIKDWNSSGLRMIGAMPQAAAWVFHSLIGAMCVHTNQLDLALELATQRIQRRHSDESNPLFLEHGLVGWPDVFDTTCTKAWPFLMSLAQQFPWVAEAFGDEESFQASLEGYYLLLSWLEFIDLFEKGRVEILNKEGGLRPDVPPMFLDEPLLAKAVRKLLEDRQTLVAFAKTRNVSAADQIKHWPVWIGRMFEWLDKLNHFGWRRRQPEAVDHFAADMNR